MKRRIFTFNDFVTEQNTTSGSNPDILTGGTTPQKAPETKRQAKSRMAKSLVKSIFGDFGDLGSLDSGIEETKEVKEGLPYKGCGTNDPYPIEKTPMSLRGFKAMLNYLDQKGAGDYKRTLGDLAENRAVIIGLRNNIATKKESINQDRFIDGLYFIPQDSKDEDTFTPYQITTVPSLSYYGKNPLNPEGVGIKLPGDTLYYLKEETLGSSKYKMMVEGEPISIGRYPEGVISFETYKPINIKSKQNCGMQIHKSSKVRGVCVGPWSAGCQVFADGTEWDQFISKGESQTKNSGRFFYALIELDSFSDNEGRSALSAATMNSQEYAKWQSASKNTEKAPNVDIEYDVLSDTLYKAMKGPGTDEDAVYSALGSLRNKDDWKNLVKTFGKKDGMTLPEWINDDMGSGEVAKVNSILKKAGISV